jgi:HSP20 family molecular chaperone IbpA
MIALPMKKKTGRDPDAWMWERARAMLEEADRLQRRFFQPQKPGGRRPCWQPAVDVFETAGEIWIQVALPGVAPERITVEVVQSVLVVSGERVVPAAFRDAAVHRLEIPHGRFERRIELEAGSYELTHRKVVDGCLFLGLTRLA